ncbi:hypothetical protein Hanom_Chr14g01320711 [Helianthus anomalus]
MKKAQIAVGSPCMDLNYSFSKQIRNLFKQTYDTNFLQLTFCNVLAHIFISTQPTEQSKS